MNRRWLVGDVVRLRSFGPNMTVRSVWKPSGDTTCIWFIGDELRSGRFPAKVLRWGGDPAADPTVARATLDAWNAEQAAKAEQVAQEDDGD